MRLGKLLLLAAVVFSMGATAQDDLQITVDKKGKVGFADRNGNVIIACAYESVLPFVDGTAIVTKSGKSGMIDQRGNVVLPLKYTQLTQWNDGLYLAKSGKKMGLVNRQGQIVLPVKYSHISDLNSHGRAWVSLGGGLYVSDDGKRYTGNCKYGILDSNGRLIIEPKYKGLYEFAYNGTQGKMYHEGMRLLYVTHYTTDTLKTDCSYLGFTKNPGSVYNAGIVDDNGNEILKPGLYSFVMRPENGMVRYYNLAKKTVDCGYHDLATGTSFQAAQFKGKIDDLTFWTHGDFKGDIAPVNGTEWSFINKSGKVLRSGLTSIIYDTVTSLWAAKDASGKWQVFDNANNDVVALSNFDEIKFPAHKGDKEVFMVKMDEVFGGIDKQGQVVIPFEYSAAGANTYNVVCVKKGDKWGAVSANNEPLVPTDYTDILTPTEKNPVDFWVKKDDKLFYHYSLSKKKLSDQGYKGATNFVHNLACVVPNDMIVNDTYLNRAQIFEPKTAKKFIDALDFDKCKEAFVMIINANDEMEFDLPVSTRYMELIKKEIEKHGGRKLTPGEKKGMLLEVTKTNRTYNLKSVIGEEEWNY